MTGGSRQVTHSAPLPDTSDDGAALTEATRATVTRYHAAWKARDLAAILGCYDPEVVYIDHYRGLSLRLGDLGAYVARSLPRDGAPFLDHIDRIRADGDTAFIQYQIVVPMAGRLAEFHASEAITVRSGLILRISEYATLTPGAPGPDRHAARPPAERLGLSARQLGSIAAELDAYFERRKPYLDPELDLPRVAAETGYTRNQISFLLNQVLGMSFYQYLTHKRLQHLLAALDRGHEGRIDTLAFDAGFNSLSAFYRAFRRATGLSPSAYTRGG
jgi:AraC-like DNA-binding protein/ketosteroid isomerase-like protein